MTARMSHNIHAMGLQIAPSQLFRSEIGSRLINKPKFSCLVEPSTHQASSIQEYSQRHGTMVKLATSQFFHIIMIVKLTVMKSITSLTERFVQRLEVMDGITTVHCLTFGSEKFEFGRLECACLNCRKRLLGRPTLKQQVARARCGESSASCTSSRGDEPVTTMVSGCREKASPVKPPRNGNKSSENQPVIASDMGSSPMRTRSVGIIDAIFVPLAKLALKASVRLSYTQSMRREHVPNFQRAGFLLSQFCEALLKWELSGGPMVRLRA